MGPFKPEEQESGELWGCHWRGACAVDPGVQQDCWSQGTGSSSGGAHRTGWCEFKDLQAACSPDRRWGSTSTEQSGRLSTVLCMVLLIRTVTVSQQLQRRGGGRYSVEIMENTWHHLRIKGSQETSCYRCRPLCYLMVYCHISSPVALKKVGEVSGGGGLTFQYTSTLSPETIQFY